MKPAVQIGKHGLAATVLQQVEHNLLAHELIKIKVLQSAPLDREQCAHAIAETTGAVLAHRLGRTLLLYRAHPEHPVLALPAQD